MIELHHVSKTYSLDSGVISALLDVNLSIQPTELVALMGTSGSGKTTAMNIIGLLDKVSGGHYFLDGQDVSTLSGDQMALLRNQRMGFIFQQFFLLARLNAWQNVGLPLTYRSMSAVDIKQHALSSLQKVGIAELAYHRPGQLSGGQQQRVAIARALVGAPPLILADEPTGSLDSITGQSIMDLLIDINHRMGTTIIIVTHDLHIAEQCARLVRIADGKVVE